MVRSATAVTAAIFVLVPIVGLAQQETSGTLQTADTGTRPSPEAMAVREGVAAALDGAVTIQKVIPAPPTGTWGIIAEGTGGGGIFRDSDAEVEAWLGAGNIGVTGFGKTGVEGSGWIQGGYFRASNGTSYASVGYDRPSGTDAGGNSNAGEYGVYAAGAKAGGYFEDVGGSGYAYVGHGDVGVSGYGSDYGGRFEDTNSGSWGVIGINEVGIVTRGSELGGSFQVSGAAALARAAYTRPAGPGYLDNGGLPNDGGYGVYADGELAGGYFEDRAESGYAYVGHGDVGVSAYGSDHGGWFEDTSTGSWGTIGYNEVGIVTRGSEVGGSFQVSGFAALARAAYTRPAGPGYLDNGGSPNDGVYGVYADGELAGGYFEDRAGSGYAYVGRGDQGIAAFGNSFGGYFKDRTSSVYGEVGFSTYKIYGNGSVNFVQNHPYDPASVVVYTAPEGDEVATYTRGTARLVEGETRVALGETFQWVTNPDVGLTAFLTPVEAWCDLFVAKQATNEIVVRSRDGSDCDFNYMIYGLRIGFEEVSVVQEKVEEAYIPSMADHRNLYQRRPDLRRFNSLERFKGMRLAAGEKRALDLSRAHVLRDAIVEFDPAVHELSRPPRFDDRASGDVAGRVEGEGERGEGEGRVRELRADRGGRRVSSRAELDTTIPVDDEGNVYAPSFRPSSGEVASLVEVSETVEAGDVLVIDRASAGVMRRGFEGNDSGVIGVVTENAGVVLGSQSPVFANEEMGGETAHHAEVAMAGVVGCKVDAAFGAIWPGDLLVTSPTPGHAMRVESPLPGTIVGKALEPLEDGTGLIRVLVMLR